MVRSDSIYCGRDSVYSYSRPGHNDWKDIATYFIYVAKLVEARKAIYRVNSNTGEIENSLVETDGYKIVEHKGWKTYK